MNSDPTQMPGVVQQDLHTPLALSEEQKAAFARDGFVKVKGVLKPETLAYMSKTIRGRVEELSREQRPMEQRDTYGKAFLQVMNLWQTSEPVQEIVFSTRLAQMAAELLGVAGVRLYHDQALYKEPGGGHTPWHADQYYWPLSSDRTVTVWVPLQETPLEMGALEFAAGSQNLVTGRDQEISDESEETLAQALRSGRYPHVVEPYEAGEVSFHLGWVFHRAGANHTDRMREVMTMIYMDKDIALKEPENRNQRQDREQWLPGSVVGERISNDDFNPILIGG